MPELYLNLRYCKPPLFFSELVIRAQEQLPVKDNIPVYLEA